MYQSLINALKNEKAIDAFDMINIYQKRACKMPVLRPIIMMRKIQSNFVLKFILLVISLFWIVLFPAIMFLKLIKYTKQINNQNYSFVKDNHNIIVATSSRIETVINGVDNDNVPNYYLEVPWVNVGEIKATKISLMSILTVFDLLKVFAYTLKGLFVSFKDIKHPVEILQTYVLFEYFMLYIGLVKLQKESFTSYWYSNHYDRWSVLLDSLGKSNTLLQHGFVSDKFKLPYRLKNIKQFYYIDEKSIDIFTSNIINFHEKITVEQLKNTLKLKQVKDKNKSIFLISRPAQLELDIELIELLGSFDIIVYIKPHPKFSKEAYKQAFSKNKQCVLIEENDFYPDVDLVVSGYSTLAIEYELLGKQIIWIPEETLESIKNKIKIFGDKNV